MTAKKADAKPAAEKSAPKAPDHGKRFEALEARLEAAEKIMRANGMSFPE